MKPAISLLLLWLFCQLSHGATTLAYYAAGTDPTSTSNPVDARWTKGSSSTYVTYTVSEDRGEPMLIVRDPGNAASAAPDPVIASSLTLNRTINATSTTAVRAEGWTLSTRLRVPEEIDPGVAWSVSSNLWVGYIHAQDVVTTDRWLWAFQYGKEADGRAVMLLYGTSQKYYFDSNYHTYSMTFDPLTQKASVYVDGNFITEYSGAAILTGGNSSSIVYWGDNSAQKVSQTQRVAYFQSVEFALVPEPSKVLFCMFGVGWLLLARRRAR